MKRPKTRQHNYVRKLHYLVQSGVIPRTAGLHHITVYHDDWCGIYRRQRCNCDPELRIAWSQPDAARN